MAVQLFTNNAASVLTAGITNSELTLPLISTAGFPEPTGGDFFLATLVGYDVNGNENAWEIVKITANSTLLDTLTVAETGRGQEGTTALAWAQATRIELRLTAGATESKANLGTAAYTASTAYAPAAQGVTNGNSHDHSGGDGAQLAYSGLSGLPTLGNAAAKDVGTGSTQVAAGDHNHSAVYQALDSDLTALAGLSTTGLIERTGAGTAAIVTKPSGAIVGTTDTQTLSGKTITALKETKTASSGYNFDLAAGNYFTHTASANNLTVSNVPASGTVASFIIELTNGGAYTFAFWSGVKWAGGAVPALTASGVDILGFYTHDGGTTWRGLLLAKDSK